MTCKKRSRQEEEEELQQQQPEEEEEEDEEAEEDEEGGGRGRVPKPKADPEPTAAAMAHRLQQQQQQDSKDKERNPLGPSTLLPYETIKDILTRLPVQSLIRFECVSKPFLSLIKSPEFVAAHLARSSRRPAILLRRFHNPSGSNFFVSFIDPASSLLRDIRVPFIGSLIRFPKIVASASGLLCLDISPCYAAAFVLWNVAASRFRSLPRPRLLDTHHPYWMVAAGFAHHPPSGDFFLVRIAAFRPDSAADPQMLHEARAEVYSWRADSWKVLDHSLTDPALASVSVSEGQHGVPVNGSINWVATGVGKLGNRKFIVCYDMGREEFGRIPVPDLNGDVCVKVMEFKDSLALALYPSLTVYPLGAGGLARGMMDRVELWVMDDGNRWTKLHCFQSSFALAPGCPMGIWNDCELIMKRHEGQCVSLSVMNPRTQEIKKFPICPPDFSCDVYRYVESLVPVSGCAEQ